MKQYSALILILFLSFSSCQKANDEDPSLSLEEYQQMGMPDHTIIWGMNEYSTAFYVLNTLKYENPSSLPASGSEKSGVLFSRMTSVKNLSFLQDDSIPLNAKADMIKWFVNTLMELKVAYSMPGSQEQYYIRELIDIDIFRLEVSHLMLDLGMQINASDDPSDRVMQADYPQIQNMYLNLLVELFEIQEYTSLVPEESLELLADSLSASVHLNKHWFDAPTREGIRQVIKKVINKSSSRKIIGEFNELMGMLS